MSESHQSFCLAWSFRFPDDYSWETRFPGNLSWGAEARIMNVMVTLTAEGRRQLAKNLGLEYLEGDQMQPSRT